MRLIDADALLEQMKHRNEFVGRPSDPVCLVEDAPTIDAVPVVRCEDCKWFINDHNEVDGWMTCTLLRQEVDKEWFCRDGERKPK